MVKSCETCCFNIDSQTFDLKRCKKCSRTDRDFYQSVPTIQTYLIKNITIGEEK